MWQIFCSLNLVVVSNLYFFAKNAANISLQDASTDNKTEETGGQDGEKESTAEAVDDLDFSFSTKKKKKKKKVCVYYCSAFHLFMLFSLF